MLYDVWYPEASKPRKLLVFMIMKVLYYIFEALINQILVIFWELWWSLLSSLRKGCFLFITINYFNLSMKMVVCTSRFYRMVNNQYFIES